VTTEVDGALYIRKEMQGQRNSIGIADDYLIDIKDFFTYTPSTYLKHAGGIYAAQEIMGRYLHQA
jgi:hypothetical protein